MNLGVILTGLSKVVNVVAGVKTLLFPKGVFDKTRAVLLLVGAIILGVVAYVFGIEQLPFFVETLGELGEVIGEVQTPQLE